MLSITLKTLTFLDKGGAERGNVMYIQHMQTAGNQAANYNFHFQDLHEGFLSRLSYFSEQNYRNGIKHLCTPLFCSYM